jgi:hypothetical protein
MHKRIHIALFIIVLIGITIAVQGQYLWLTDCEITYYGERIKWWHGDTLEGPVHSNSQIAIMQDPVFYDIVSSTADDFWRGTGYNPTFLGPPPIFRAPRVSLSYPNDRIRLDAQLWGQRYSQPYTQYAVEFQGDQIAIHSWPLGSPEDTSVTWTVTGFNNHCLFFEGQIHVRGTVAGRITIGCARTIYIDDNILYVDSDSLTGRVPANSPNMLGLVSDGFIKIANTPANGRENSGGLGLNQTNRDSTSVIICAALFAGETFTFDQQNDLDSGYVCNCTPDDRGTLYLFGGVTQMRRGYLHRSNRSSTGYLNRLRFDQRLRQLRPPSMDGGTNSSHDPDTVNFGDVTVGSTVWDTVAVRFVVPGNLGLVYATTPFYGQRNPPYSGQRFVVPVRFTPSRTGEFRGSLQVQVAGITDQVPLVGRGIRPTAPPLAMDIAPNPFNQTTTIHYTLKESGAVKLMVYDMLGRTVQAMEAPQIAGEQQWRFDGGNLASGIYFIKLQTGTQQTTAKLMLLK